MKIASITAAFVFVATAAAWDLKVFMQNGQAVKAQGNLDSGCVNYGPDVTSPVDRAVFHESKQANTFELYETKDCKIPVSYRNTKGDYKLKPTKIQSYKVYEVCHSGLFSMMFLTDDLQYR